MDATSPQFGGKVIRVIETKSFYYDPLTTDEATYNKLVRGLPQVRPIEGPWKPADPVDLLYRNPIESNLMSVVARDVLASPLVFPVIYSRGAATDIDSQIRGTRTRPPRRVIGADTANRSVAIATDEPIDLKSVNISCIPATGLDPVTAWHLLGAHSWLKRGLPIGPPRPQPRVFPESVFDIQPRADPQLVWFLGRIYEITQDGTSLVNWDAMTPNSMLCEVSRLGAQPIWQTVCCNGRDDEDVEQYFVDLSRKVSIHRASAQLTKKMNTAAAELTELLNIAKDRFPNIDLEQVTSIGGLMKLLKSDGPQLAKLAAARRTAKIIQAACPHNADRNKYAKVQNTQTAQSLKRWVADVFADGWALCRNCNGPCVCRHQLALMANALKSQATYDSQVAALQPFAITIGRQSFCRHCGEMLYSAPDKANMSSAPRTELDTALWGAIMKALSAVVKFATPMSNTAVASRGASIASAWLADAASMTTDDMVPLLTVVYAYAYILTLLTQDKTASLVVSKLDKVSKKQYTRVSDIAAELLDHLVTHGARRILDAMPSITPEKVRDMYAAAYKAIAQVYTPANPNENTSLTSLLNYLLDVSAVYKYAHQAAVISGKVPIQPSKTPEEARRTFETVLGIKLGTILKSDRPPLYDKLFTIPGNPKPDSWAGKYNAFVKAIQDNSQLPQARGNRIRFNVLWADGRTEPFCWHTEFREMPAEPQPLPPITWLYDESGQKHKWDEYTYKDGPGSAITDIMCSVCHTQRSKLADLNVSKTEETVRQQSSSQGFFAFYSMRCPAGGIHEWTTHAVCKKCQLGSVTSGDYQKKYTEQYRADKISSISLATPATPAPPAVAANMDTETAADIGPAKAISSLVGSPLQSILTLGCTEGAVYSKLMSAGAGAPVTINQIMTMESVLRGETSQYMRYWLENGKLGPQPSTSNVFAGNRAATNQYHLKLVIALCQMWVNAANNNESYKEFVKSRALDTIARAKSMSKLVILIKTGAEHDAADLPLDVPTDTDTNN